MTMKSINSGDQGFKPTSAGHTGKENATRFDIKDSFKKEEGGSLNLISPGKIASLSTSKAAEVLLSKIENESIINKIWEVDLGHGSVPEPVLHDKHIFINAFGYTHKYDLDGNEVWSKNTGASASKPPAFDSNGNLYFAPQYKGQNDLVSLDKDGNERWRSRIGRSGCSHLPMLGHDGKLYIIDNENEVSCYNTDGKMEWTKTVKGALSQKPFLDKNGILHISASVEGGFSSSGIKLDPKKKGKYLGVELCKLQHHLTVDKDGNTYGFREGKFRVTDINGKELWAVGLPGDTFSLNQKIGTDGNIYVRVRNHTIICFQPDGREKWRLQGDQKNEPLSDNFAWAKDGTFYMTGDRGNWNLYAINPDGSKKWVHKEDKHISGLKVGQDGTIYTGGDLYPLKAFSPVNGNRLWNLDVSLAFGENYKITDTNDIILTTDDHKLMKFHYKNKEEIQNEMEKSIKQARETGDKLEREKNLTIKKGKSFVEIGGVKLRVNKENG